MRKHSHCKHPTQTDVDHKPSSQSFIPFRNGYPSADGQQSVATTTSPRDTTSIRESGEFRNNYSELCISNRILHRQHQVDETSSKCVSVEVNGTAVPVYFQRRLKAADDGHIEQPRPIFNLHENRHTEHRSIRSIKQQWIPNSLALKHQRMK